MAKKKGKAKSSSKKIKKAKAPKKIAQASAEKPVLKDALHDLEILSEENRADTKISGVEKEEKEIEKKEVQIMAEEEKVEKLEKEIKKEITGKPLTRLTMLDINKGIIGAFIGVV